MHDDDTTALTDELLAVRCQLGERPAFDALVDRWHEPLWYLPARQDGAMRRDPMSQPDRPSRPGQ